MTLTNQGFRKKGLKNWKEEKIRRRREGLERERERERVVVFMKLH